MSTLKTNQVTVWGHPLGWIKTQWGNLPYKFWLKCEIDRWFEKDFRLAWVEIKNVTDGDGNAGDVAMFTEQRNIIEVSKE